MTQLVHRVDYGQTPLNVCPFSTDAVNKAVISYDTGRYKEVIRSLEQVIQIALAFIRSAKEIVYGYRAIELVVLLAE